MTLRPAIAWEPPRVLAKARSAQCGPQQRKRARIRRRRRGDWDSPRHVCAPVRLSPASVRVPTARPSYLWENRIRPGCKETMAVTCVPPLRSDRTSCGMLRTSICVFSSDAVASQYASAEFVVRRSIPIMYLAANENLLKFTSVWQTCLAARKVQPQPVQLPSGRNPAATVADSPPSRASPCVVTRRESAALPSHCLAI